MNNQALTLEDCLAAARTGNPVIGASMEKIRELVADYQAARSRLFPRLLLSAFYTVQPSDRFAPGGGVSSTESFQREGFAGVTGKQVVFDGWRTQYNSQAARLDTTAQEQEVRRTADEVDFVVTEAFYRMVEAKENLKVAREALQQRQEFAKLSEAFFKAGKVTRLDSFRAQSRVSEAEQAAVEAENAVRVAGEILTRLLALGEQAQVDIRGRLPQEFKPAADVSALWEEALERNPEIKKLDVEISRSQAAIKAARGGYFPELSIQAAADVRHRDMGGTKPEWLAGFFLEYPFYEGGLTRAQVSRASSRYRRLAEEKRDRLNTLKVDLTRAWRDHENARRGVDAARQTLATNEEAYASAQTLYRHGKAIGLEVLQAQVELTDSRFNIIRYAVAYEIAKARIEQITGPGPAHSHGQNNSGGRK
ncbi:MAG: TolC family protein [Deltaproteobacteria bacterium]|nr:TolC family protein [Deltaproteobacteria bacterium]